MQSARLVAVGASLGNSGLRGGAAAPDDESKSTKLGLRQCRVRFRLHIRGQTDGSGMVRNALLTACEGSGIEARCSLWAFENLSVQALRFKLFSISSQAPWHGM